jgi:hypothetical protein
LRYSSGGVENMAISERLKEIVVKKGGFDDDSLGRMSESLLAFIMNQPGKLQSIPVVFRIGGPLADFAIVNEFAAELQAHGARDIVPIETINAVGATVDIKLLKDSLANNPGVTSELSGPGSLEV